LFRLNIIIPLLLVVPIAFGGAPAAHAAAVYTVLFALFGTFGATIPALRDAEHGMIRRIAHTPLDARGVVFGRALAGGCIDALQLLPSLAIILIAGSPSLGVTSGVLVTLVGSLVFANCAGLLIAAVARSVGEGALFAAVTTLLLLHASGVFRTPAEGSLGAAVEMIAPYRALHELLLAVSVGNVVEFAGLWLSSIALAVVVTAMSHRMLHALARADGNS
jgi:hypothetical protein